MRVDSIAFESPIGLEDGTHHLFLGHGRAGSFEHLSVEFELPGVDAWAVDEVMADMLESLGDFHGRAFRLVEEGIATLAGKPGRFLTYRLDDGGDDKLQTLGKVIVADISDGGSAGGWLKFMWGGIWDPPESVDVYLDPIIASVTAGADAPAGVLAEHERHEFGLWVVDVPAHFRGPRTFIWEDPDAELRIELSVLEDGDPEPVLEPGAAIAGGEAIARGEQALEDGERFDLRVRSDADPNGESTLILAKRRIEACWVVLSASAPSSEGARLTAVIDTLLGSIRAA